MSDFWFYFQEGMHHILGAAAMDHQLFITVLSIIYTWRDWRQVLVLVTAFTIGHSVTLALSVLDIVRLDSGWVEFLIPCTILITAIFNYSIKDFNLHTLRVNYFLAMGFGLIHGMGFANNIRLMLASDQGIVTGLLGFNTGLEVGQIWVVTIILTVTKFCTERLGVPRKYWVWLISGIAGLLAIQMMITRIPGVH